MSASGSPASRREMASRRWCGVNLGRLPMATPLAFARSRPSPVRARISSRSNSAKPPRMVSIKRPCAVVVSAHVSRSDLKPAPFSATAPSVLRRSLVDLAKRSSLVTTRTSPLSSPAISRASCLRSARAPDRLDRPAENSMKTTSIPTFSGGPKPCPRPKSWNICAKRFAGAGSRGRPP
jgi:hypothetical protein